VVQQRQLVCWWQWLALQQQRLGLVLLSLLALQVPVQQQVAAAALLC
jgi:hypothetical protein